MNIKDALLQCLTEKGLGMTKPEILKLMEEELEKPEDEIDCEFVDLCVELLAEIEGFQLPEFNEVPYMPID